MAISAKAWGITNIDPKIRQLRSQLSMFKDAVRTKILRRAAGKAGAVIKAAIRGQVPPRMKEVKRLIEMRFVATVDADLVQVKIGAGVGKASRLTDQQRTHSGGVGIGGRNLHWFIQGTGERETNDGQRTGKMPPQLGNVVREGFESAKSAAMRVFIAEVEKGIEEEKQKVYAALRKASA